MPGGYCRSSGTWGSPSAAKVGPLPVGPRRRWTRPRTKPSLRDHPLTPRRPSKTYTDKGLRSWGPAGSPNQARRHGRPRGSEFPAGGWAPSRVPPCIGVDKLSTSCQKSSEDLGSKAKVAWAGRIARGCVSHCSPPRRTLPPNPKETLGRGEATSPPKLDEEGPSRQRSLVPLT